MIPSAALPIAGTTAVQIQCQPVQKIDSLPEAAEHAFMLLKTAEKYELHDKLERIRRRKEHEDGLMMEIGLVIGASVFVCISETKEKLKRLKSGYRRKGRGLLQGIVARVGDSFEDLRVKIANSIWTIWRIFSNPPDEKDLLERRWERRKDHRWTAPKNFQPVFV